MWDKVLELIGDAAPVVGTMLGGPAGAAVGGLVAKALGVDNTPEAIEEALKSNPDALVKIKEIEASKELAQLENQYKNKVEDNRAAEHAVGIVVQDKQNARAAASALGSVQTQIANKVYNQSSWGIPLLLAMNVALIVLAPTLHLDVTAVVAIGNLIGIALSNQYRERQSILEFLFGSSISEKKDK